MKLHIEIKYSMQKLKLMPRLKQINIVNFITAIFLFLILVFEENYFVIKCHKNTDKNVKCYLVMIPFFRSFYFHMTHTSE